jgi:hypothetical protein
MRKLGLVSVAAALALTSGAMASDVKISGFASVAGVKKSINTKESLEYYDMDAELHLNAKNDDGVKFIMAWDIYDGEYGNPGDSANYVTAEDSNGSAKAVSQENAFVAPKLKYGYIVAPLGNLKIIAGYTEPKTNDFGTTAFSPDKSLFKAVVKYKPVKDVTLVLADVQAKEAMDASEGGGSLEAGDGDKNKVLYAVVANLNSWKIGVRSWTLYNNTYTVDNDGDGVKDATPKDATDTGLEAFIKGSVAGVGIVANYASRDGDSYDDAQSGLLMQVSKNGLAGGKLDVAVASLTLKDGMSTGDRFDPTILVDKVAKNIGSTKDDGTSVVVVPVNYKVNSKLKVGATVASGSVMGESYTETDLTVSYALGKQTTLSAAYASAGGDITDDPNGSEDGWTYAELKLKAAF